MELAERFSTDTKLMSGRADGGRCDCRVHVVVERSVRCSHCDARSEVVDLRKLKTNCAHTNGFIGFSSI